MVLLNTEHMKGLLVAISFLAVVMGIVFTDAAERWGCFVFTESLKGRHSGIPTETKPIVPGRKYDGV